MQKKKIKCHYDGCGRTSCSYFNLKRHIDSSHMGVRKFCCQTCGRFLSSKQNYVDHQNIHSGAKPYVCEFPGCSMRFRQLSQFYLHSQLHNEINSHLDLTQSLFSPVLSLLTTRLSEDSTKFYTIPLLPYSIDNIHLPEIVKSEKTFIKLDSAMDLH